MPSPTPSDEGTAVLVPVTWLPKRPLLSFDLLSQEGVSLSLLTRRENAGVVGSVLFDLLQEIDGTTADAQLITAVAAASPSVWDHLKERHKADRIAALVDYVRLGTGVPLLRAQAEELLAGADALTRTAYRTAGMSGWWEESYQDNPATNGALVAAYRDPALDSSRALVAWIENYHTTVRRWVAGAGASQRLAGWLRAFLRAGVMWAAIVPEWVEPGDILLYKTTELRPSGDRHVSTFVHYAHMALARFYHLRIHSPASSIVINSVTATSAPGLTVGSPETFETVRLTDELFTCYTADEGPDLAQFVVRYRLTWQLRAGYLFGIALAVSALIAAILSAAMTPGVAAVLAIPTSPAAAFVVVREDALTASYLAWHRRVLVGSALLVWVVVLLRMHAALLGEGWW